MRNKNIKKGESIEEYYSYYFGIILQGSMDDFQKLKRHIIENTGLSIKYIKSSRFYLLIQPAPTITSPSKEW